ncbi:hypothetical protein GOP47_0026920 [Adiantum capillus-veneris]|nr:hypothetical protein GOP47_0026920 [Adiantum capillus-veneris]
MGERVCMGVLSLKAVNHLFFAYTPPYMSSCQCCPFMNGRPSSTHHGLASLILLDSASLLFDHATLQHFPSPLHWPPTSITSTALNHHLMATFPCITCSPSLPKLSALGGLSSVALEALYLGN